MKSSYVSCTNARSSVDDIGQGDNDPGSPPSPITRAPPDTAAGMAVAQRPSIRLGTTIVRIAWRRRLALFTAKTPSRRHQTASLTLRQAVRRTLLFFGLRISAFPTSPHGRDSPVVA